MAAIPRPQAPIVDRAGLATREWYSYLQQLRDGGSLTQAQQQQLDELAGKVAALENAASPSFAIVGSGSINVGGTPANGMIQLTLEGDSDAPDATWYYGTGPDGARGWYRLADALEVTADLDKEVDAGTGVATFGLADLPDSGVGAALVKITRDGKGRVEGTESATTDDLAEGATNRWFPEAPVDGKRYARKDGGWSEVASVTLSLPIMQSTGVLAEVPLTSDYKVQIRLADGSVAYIPAVSA